MEPATSPQSSRLLSLPAEIRHQVYDEVFFLDPTPKVSLSVLCDKPDVVGSLPQLSLLETCHQVYAEARLVPFESNVFEFYRWYGSSSVDCRRFLDRLAPWQIEAIREVRLGITECEIRGLGLVGASETFTKICELFGTGLRSLTLDIDPQAVVWSKEPSCPEESRKVWWVGEDAAWMTDGLVKLKSLQRLHVRTFDQSALPPCDGEDDSDRFCEQVLSANLPWCGGVVVCLQKEKGRGRKRCDGCGL
jgi:hypothetical protein